METETARSALYCITALAAVAWLAGLRFVLATFRKPGIEIPTPDEGLDDAGDIVAGALQLEGRPDELVEKAAAVLARNGLAPGLPVKILRAAGGRVIFEGVDPGAAASRRNGGGTWTRAGQLRFTAVDRQRTAVEYVVAVGSGKGLRALASAFLALGLVAIVVGFWLVYVYAAPHPLPAVRGQSLQMLQVAHFLWPPFLFAGLQRARRRMVRAWLETLVHNLPYLPA